MNFNQHNYFEWVQFYFCFLFWELFWMLFINSSNHFLLAVHKLLQHDFNSSWYIIKRRFKGCQRGKCQRVLCLRWLNTVLAVSEYRSFAKSWQEKGCSSQAETWQVKNILMKDFDWQVKFDFFVVSMATWRIDYNLKISLLLSLHKIHSLDFPINLHAAYYN